MADLMTGSMKEEVSSTPFVSVNVDETTDVSIIKQLYNYSYGINIKDQGNIQLFVFIAEVAC